MEHSRSCRLGQKVCSCPKKVCIGHFLVLHVVGEFELFWDFVQDFADYLFIEDSTRENDTFHQRNLQGRTVINKLDNFNVVV